MKATLRDPLVHIDGRRGRRLTEEELSELLDGQVVSRRVISTTYHHNGRETQVSEFTTRQGEVVRVTRNYEVIDF